MGSIKEYLDNFRNIKGKFKYFFFRDILEGFECAENEILCIDKHIEDIHKNLTNISEAVNHINTKLNDFEKLSENVRNLNAESESFRLLKNDFENLSVNVRNNNDVIEALQSESDLLKVKIHTIQSNIRNNSSINAQEKTENKIIDEKIPVLAYDDIDYFDFENHFRGSIENIKKTQSFYVKYFKDKKNVLDIGCGRGEFLSLMSDNNINAHGVDIYQPYVEYCCMKNLDATCGDGIKYLENLDCSDDLNKIDGIFAGQVVEHLETHQIISLCNNAYKKLAEGGCIIIETPNPVSLSIYTNAFYIDPSHIKPVHPLTMKYYLEKAGFRNIEIIFTENSRAPYDIPELKYYSDSQDIIDNIDEFNNAMKKVSEMMFGSQDYAVIAVK
ncbi:MAG: methyltransferase domain-containing protein [Oscillospiraceae bacterium]|nr:methyltransferase domain-containing protein [Oscillospiraceae bacterium]